MPDEILYPEKVRLPVWKTVRESFRYVLSHLRQLAVPILLLFIAEAASDYLLADGFKRQGAWQELLPAWQIVMTVIESAFCVGLYRTVIAGEMRNGPAFFCWDWRLWRYLMTGVKLTFVLLLLAGLLLGLSRGYLADLHARPAWQFALLAALASPLFYLTVRMLLAFPAAALSETKMFRLSWRATRGNMLRLLAVMALVTIPTLIAAAVAGIALTSSGSPPLLLGLSTLVDTAGSGLTIVAISLSYRTLAPRPQAPEEPVP